MRFPQRQSLPKAPDEPGSDQLPPELVPVVTLLSAQSHRRYHEGIFMLYYDLNGDGKPADRVWKEVYGILTGNQLAFWDAASLAKFRDNPDQLLETSSKPTYLNFTDAAFNAMRVLPAAKQQLENVLIVSTTLKNRYLIQFRDYDSLKEWYLSLRLSAYEYHLLQEAYTGALLSARGALLLDIRTILAEKRFNHEDWVKIRYGSGTAWKRCYAVVEPSTTKRRLFVPGRVLLFESENTKKKNVVGIITAASLVTAVYPQLHLLIDQSTIMKLEGLVCLNPLAKKKKMETEQTLLFLMPEQHLAVPGFDTLIRFLMPLLDAFGLYGRPKRLKADRVDPELLLFGLPTLPHVHYLTLNDMYPLAGLEAYLLWDQSYWVSQLKQVMKLKMASGYEGCGSSRGVAGAYNSLNSPRVASTSSLGSRPAPKKEPAADNPHKLVHLLDIYQKYSTIDSPLDRFHDRNKLLNGGAEEIEEEKLPTLMRKMSLMHGPMYPTSDKKLFDVESEESEESTDSVQPEAPKAFLLVPESRSGSHSLVASPLTQYTEFNKQVNATMEFEEKAKKHYPQQLPQVQQLLLLRLQQTYNSPPHTPSSAEFGIKALAPPQQKQPTAQGLAAYPEMSSLRNAGPGYANKPQPAAPSAEASGRYAQQPSKPAYPSPSRDERAVNQPPQYLMQKLKPLVNLSQHLSSEPQNQDRERSLSPTKPRFISSPNTLQNTPVGAVPPYVKTQPKQEPSSPPKARSPGRKPPPEQSRANQYSYPLFQVQSAPDQSQAQSYQQMPSSYQLDPRLRLDRQPQAYNQYLYGQPQPKPAPAEHAQPSQRQPAPGQSQYPAQHSSGPKPPQYQYPYAYPATSYGQYGQNAYGQPKPAQPTYAQKPSNPMGQTARQEVPTHTRFNQDYQPKPAANYPQYSGQTQYRQVNPQEGLTQPDAAMRSYNDSSYQFSAQPQSFQPRTNYKPQGSDQNSYTRRY